MSVTGMNFAPPPLLSQKNWNDAAVGPQREDVIFLKDSSMKNLLQHIFTQDVPLKNPGNNLKCHAHVLKLCSGCFKLCIGHFCSYIALNFLQYSITLATVPFSFRIFSWKSRLWLICFSDLHERRFSQRISDESKQKHDKNFILLFVLW